MGKVNEDYIVKAKKMNETQQERLLSRMDEKLHKRIQKNKITQVEAIAMQLELEDELLHEWREKIVEIREDERKKAEKHAKKNQKADSDTSS